MYEVIWTLLIGEESAPVQKGLDNMYDNFAVNSKDVIHVCVEEWLHSQTCSMSFVKNQVFFFQTWRGTVIG